MTFPRIAALAVSAAVCLACSPGDGGGSYVSQPKPAAAEVVLSVEQLGAKVGCKPRIQVDATDMRTGYCKTRDGEFFLTTFTTQEGKDAWMDRAPEYNPHLVGHLWTALSSRKVLDRIKKRLGGDLHLKDHRIQTPAPAAGEGGY